MLQCCYIPLSAFFVAATKAFDENERLLMNAKINFMASNDLQHVNVIHFVGAITDDLERELEWGTVSFFCKFILLLRSYIFYVAYVLLV